MVAKLGEEIKSLRRKLVELESQGGNEQMLRQMLEKKGKELANLQVRTDVETDVGEKGKGIGQFAGENRC